MTYVLLQRETKKYFESELQEINQIQILNYKAFYAVPLSLDRTTYKLIDFLMLEKSTPRKKYFV